MASGDAWRATLVLVSDDLLHDDLVTLWGLFFEVYEGIQRRLERELRGLRHDYS